MAGELFDGSGRALGYNKETSWAVPSNTAFTVVRSLPGAAVNETASQLQTGELNSRRAIVGFRRGAKKTGVTIPMELFYSGDASAGSQQFDDFMESWACGAWVAAEEAIAAQTVTVGTPGATTTFTAGTAVTGIAQGDWISVTGYSGAQAGNNGFYRVVSIASLELTLATPNYSSLVAGAAQGTAVVLQVVASLTPSTSIKSIAFDEAFTNTASSLTLAKMAIGCVANNFSLTLTPDQIITMNFDFMGRVFGVGATRAAAATSVSVYSTVSAAATWPAAATTQPMTANDSLAYIMQDNVLVGVATGITLNGTNNLEELMPIGATCPYGLGKGYSTLTGTMNLYLIDSSYWTKFRAETTLGLSIRLMDPDTAAPGSGYAIDIPKIKITSLGDQVAQTNIMQNVAFTALEAAAGTGGAATINMRVSRLT